MLSNAYFLAKFRLDTAENEPAKKLQKFAKFANFANPNRPQEADDRGAGRVPRGPRLRLRPRLPRPRGARWTRRVVARFWQIFGKVSLVFGCIGADLCK